MTVLSYNGPSASSPHPFSSASLFVLHSPMKACHFSHCTRSERILVAFITMGTLIAAVVCVGLFALTFSTSGANANVGISSHVLDQTKGIPASGVNIDLYIFDENAQQFRKLSNKITNSDGRVDSFIDESLFTNGKYKVVFHVGEYFDGVGEQHFYPEIEITFLVNNSSQHYHVPILLSPFGFSTYRGS